MAIYMWREKIPEELCFTANTAGSTVKLNKVWSPTSVTLETSTDGGNWSAYTIGDTITLTNVWDKVYRRTTSGTDVWLSTSDSAFYKFVMTWSIAWSGNLTSLLNKNLTTALSSFCFNFLFSGCTSLTTAPSFPTTTVNMYSCASMFYNCTSLTTAPSLPATTLAEACYWSMFSWCTALTTIPKLDATTLADYCYQEMFYWCSKIKMSTSKTWDYQTAYRIPTSWTWTTATYWWRYMFTRTWWTFTSDPSINTTYYTSNTVV